MAAKLHADLGFIFDRLGQEFGEQLTYPGIYRAATLNVSPVLIEQDGVTTVVISDADSDACRAINEDVKKSVYGGYFSWDNDNASAPLSFEAAVRVVVGPDKVICDPALPLTRYEALKKTGEVALAALPPIRPLFAYKKSRHEIETQLIATRNSDAVAFAPFVATLRDGDRLVAVMTATEKGFEPLDALCAEKDIPAIYVSAPHEVELFTGLPGRALRQQCITTLFTPHSEDILVLSEEPLIRADFRPVGVYSDLGAALKASNQSEIAIQKEVMAAGTFEAIASTGIDFSDATYVIKRWQDMRASDDAVYFFFAANAVLKGLEAAKAFFDRHKDSGKLVERDLVAAYHQGVARFAARYGFKDRVGSYFDIVHSGTRTHLPATAGDYPVGANDRTIKFDMGLTVTDAYGLIRGVSDIARNICHDREIKVIHDRLRTILVDELIPAIRPGMSGGEIHAIGVSFLKPLEPELKRLGLLPEGKTVEHYTRDCGHTIQRQTISAVYFLPGVAEKVQNTMLGCAEYVWPVGDVLIAVEDGYLVTEEGAIAFTVAGTQS